jgi:fructose/tagatose bisphosphate aldolase
MKVVTERNEVLAILDHFRRAGAAFFAPNAEACAEIEGVCLAAQRFADEYDIAHVPVAVGMTSNYKDNPQFRKISTPCTTAEDVSGFDGGDVVQGCELWLRHLAAYEDLMRYFPAVRLLPFIDHGWAPDPEDRRLLFNDDVVRRMAIIMYDASILDWDENVRLTRAYVERYRDRVVVEAACDKIYDPADVKRLKLSREDQLSRPDRVEQFVRDTGVDLIVPNLGTEHRSVGVGTAERKYERRIARQITERVGAIQALHGSSCLGGDVGSTASDGIIKVNFYTAMAVGGGNKIYNLLKRHEKKVLEERSLWINSASYFDEVRRRHVATVCYDMFKTLGYEKLATA